MMPDLLLQEMQVVWNGAKLSDGALLSHFPAGNVLDLIPSCTIVGHIN